MKAQPQSCDLCGLPLPANPKTFHLPETSYHFCCMGCQQVFILLTEVSDDSDPATFRQSELYRKCQDMGIVPRTPADLSRYLRNQAAPMGSPPEEKSSKMETPRKSDTLNLILKINNMWCPACAWIIDETLLRTDGIVSADCNFSTDRLRCEYNPVKTSPQKIVRVLEKLGYDTAHGEAAESGTARKEFIRLAVSAFLTANVMMLSFALYSGFFTEFSSDTIEKLSWPIAVLATVVLVYGGKPIYIKAFKGLGSIAFGMETLITAGSFSAYGFSTLNFLSGSMHLYYDTASMLITLVLLGKALERKAKNRVRADLESFFSLRPSKVKICSDVYPRGRYVHADQLKTGDIFQVTEGETVPADGRIIAGNGSLDESTLTGEPLPLNAGPGDSVRSGTKVLRGTLRARAERVGPDSILGQMLEILQKSLSDRTSLEGRTDRCLKWFVPSILLLALGTGVAGRMLGLSVEAAILRAVTVMVISCPCALGVAIPLARVAGISAAGKKGLLVRSFFSFEKAARVDAIVFDKTGTITHGHWSLLEVKPVSPFDEHGLLSIAAALEADSDHYIATEIKRRAEEKRIDPVFIHDIKLFENGISGKFNNDPVKIGSSDFLCEELRSFKSISLNPTDTGNVFHSAVYMSSNGKICGIFIFGDKIRSSTEEAVSRLKNMGLQLYLISGDGANTSRSVAGRIGIDHVSGSMLPQDKAAFIESLQGRGHRVAMVGDGVNDAPALLQSDLSMAIYSGSHLSNEAAELTLMRSDPMQVSDFLGFALLVNRKVFQNLLFSFLYNFAGIPIAMSGLLNPIIAVSAMLLSSLTVIGNTLLLIRRST